MGIYTISRENRVISFSQNQKEPNKVGEELGKMLLDAVKSGTPYSAIKEGIEKRYAQMEADNTRGISSIRLSCNECRDSGLQDTNHIYLSYKLNGTFITYTEYLPINNAKNESL